VYARNVSVIIIVIIFVVFIIIIIYVSLKKLPSVYSKLRMSVHAGWKKTESNFFNIN